MASSITTFGDDAEGVILQERAAADTPQKTLLHATVKTYNRDFRGRLEKGDVLLYVARHHTRLTISISTGTSRTVNQGISTLRVTSQM